MRITGTTDRYRASDELSNLFDYKNSPQEKPALVDLSDDCLAAECQTLSATKPWDRLVESKLFGKPSKYETAVISLKRGDTVKFGTEEFKLGEFLGLGNSTHIFALADNPDHAIRIPILTPSNGQWPTSMETKGQNGRLAAIRKLIRVFTLEAKLVPHAVPIIKEDRLGRFIIVKRLKGISGGDFLKKIKAPNYEGWSFEAALKDLSLSPLEQEQAASLLKLLELENQVMGTLSRRMFSVGAAMQYYWDAKDLKWYKTDFE